MSKILDSKNFYFKNLNGGEMLIHCEVYSYSRGWGHRATIVYDGDRWPDFKKRITYYNRTWEAFKFESVIYKVLSEYLSGKNNAAELAFIKKQVKAIADNEAAQAEAWAAAFTKKFNALSDSTKEKIKNSDVLLNSKEEADAFINLSLLLDSIN